MSLVFMIIKAYKEIRKYVNQLLSFKLKNKLYLGVML